MKKLPVILLSLMCGLQMISAPTPADAYVYRYHRGVPAVDLDWGMLGGQQGQPQTSSQGENAAPVPLTSPETAETEAANKRLPRPFFTDTSNLQRIAPVSHVPPKIVITSPRPVAQPLAAALPRQPEPEPSRIFPNISSLRGYAPPKPSQRVIAVTDKSAPSDDAPVVEVEPLKAATVDTEPLGGAPVKAAPVKAAAVKAKPVKTTVVKAIPAPVKAKPVPVRAASVQTEPIKITPEKAEAVKAEPVGTAPVKIAAAEPKTEIKAEPAKTEPINITSAKTEVVKTAPVRTESAAAKPVTEPVKAEPVGAEPDRMAKAEPLTISPVDAVTAEITPDEMKAVPPPSDISLDFAATSSEISDAVRRKLDAVAAQLQHAMDMRMQIRAYAGTDEGGQSSARRMSLSRGLMVRSYLLDKGIKATRLDVRALGSETDRAPVDRVDLVFVR
jgi:outer membrane protein OmpA-like peptidoglycan-associated protein